MATFTKYLLHENALAFGAMLDNSKYASIIEHGEEVKLYTYKDLHQAVMEAEPEIRRLFKLGDVVALLVEENASTIFLIVALLKCGVPFLPLDPDTSLETLGRNINHFGITDVIFTSNFRYVDLLSAIVSSSDGKRAPSHFDCGKLSALSGVFNVLHFLEKRTKIKSTLSCPAAFPQASGKQKSSNVRASSVAYLMTTSGTTSQPRLVRVQHRCITPNIKDLGEVFEMDRKDLVYLASPLTFDASIVQLFLALSWGSTVLVVEKSKKRKPRDLIHIIFNVYRVTVLQVIPSLFRILMFSAENQIPKHSSLRILAFGGEPFPSISQVLEWTRKKNDVRLFNLYGTTEFSAWASIHEVDYKNLAKRSQEMSSLLHKIICDNWSPIKGLSGFPCPVPLGRPLLETEVTIRDADGTILDAGQGEIFIGSRKRVSIIQDEGDLMRYNLMPTGDQGIIVGRELYYAGRKDFQVKRLGQRLNLEMLEQCLLLIPEITAACFCFEKDVAVETSQSYFKKLLLGVCIKRETVVTWEEVFKVLPSHGRPDFVVKCDYMPPTDNGKLNRKFMTGLLRRLSRNCDKVDRKDKFFFFDMDGYFKALLRKRGAGTSAVSRQHGCQNGIEKPNEKQEIVQRMNRSEGEAPQTRLPSSERSSSTIDNKALSQGDSRLQSDSDNEDELPPVSLIWGKTADEANWSRHAGVITVDKTTVDKGCTSDDTSIVLTSSSSRVREPSGSLVNGAFVSEPCVEGSCGDVQNLRQHIATGISPSNEIASAAEVPIFGMISGVSSIGAQNAGSDSSCVDMSSANGSSLHTACTGSETGAAQEDSAANVNTCLHVVASSTETLAAQESLHLSANNCLSSYVFALERVAYSSESTTRHENPLVSTSNTNWGTVKNSIHPEQSQGQIPCSKSVLSWTSHGPPQSPKKANSPAGNLASSISHEHEIPPDVASFSIGNEVSGTGSMERELVAGRQGHDSTSLSSDAGNYTISAEHGQIMDETNNANTSTCYEDVSISEKGTYRSRNSSCTAISTKPCFQIKVGGSDRYLCCPTLSIQCSDGDPISLGLKYATREVVRSRQGFSGNSCDNTEGDNMEATRSGVKENEMSNNTVEAGADTIHLSQDDILHCRELKHLLRRGGPGSRVSLIFAPGVAEPYKLLVLGLPCANRQFFFLVNSVETKLERYCGSQWINAILKTPPFPSSDHHDMARSIRQSSTRNTQLLLQNIDFNRTGLRAEISQGHRRHKRTLLARPSLWQNQTTPLPLSFQFYDYQGSLKLRQCQGRNMPCVNITQRRAAIMPSSSVTSMSGTYETVGMQSHKFVPESHNVILSHGNDTLFESLNAICLQSGNRIFSNSHVSAQNRRLSINVKEGFFQLSKIKSTVYYKNPLFRRIRYMSVDSVSSKHSLSCSIMVKRHPLMRLSCSCCLFVRGHPIKRFYKTMIKRLQRKGVTHVHNPRTFMFDQRQGRHLSHGNMTQQHAIMMPSFRVATASSVTGTVGMQAREVRPKSGDIMPSEGNVIDLSDAFFSNQIPFIDKAQLKSAASIMVSEKVTCSDATKEKVNATLITAVKPSRSEDCNPQLLRTGVQREGRGATQDQDDCHIVAMCRTREATVKSSCTAEPETRCETDTTTLPSAETRKSSFIPSTKGVITSGTAPDQANTETSFEEGSQSLPCDSVALDGRNISPSRIKGILSRLWYRALPNREAPGVSLEDSYFMLSGGNSLHALRLAEDTLTLLKGISPGLGTCSLLVDHVFNRTFGALCDYVMKEITEHASRQGTSEEHSSRDDNSSEVDEVPISASIQGLIDNLFEAKYDRNTSWEQAFGGVDFALYFTPEKVETAGKAFAASGNKEQREVGNEESIIMCPPQGEDPPMLVASDKAPDRCTAIGIEPNRPGLDVGSIHSSLTRVRTDLAGLGTMGRIEKGDSILHSNEKGEDHVCSPYSSKEEGDLVHPKEAESALCSVESKQGEKGDKEEIFGNATEKGKDHQTKEDNSKGGMFSKSSSPAQHGRSLPMLKYQKLKRKALEDHMQSSGDSKRACPDSTTTGTLQPFSTEKLRRDIFRDHSYSLAHAHIAPADKTKSPVTAFGPNRMLNTLTDQVAFLTNSHDGQGPTSVVIQLVGGEDVENSTIERESQKRKVTEASSDSSDIEEQGRDEKSLTDVVEENQCIVQVKKRRVDIPRDDKELSRCHRSKTSSLQQKNVDACHETDNGSVKEFGDQQGNAIEDESIDQHIAQQKQGPRNDNGTSSVISGDDIQRKKIATAVLTYDEDDVRGVVQQSRSGGNGTLGVKELDGDSDLGGKRSRNGAGLEFITSNVLQPREREEHCCSIAPKAFNKDKIQLFPESAVSENDPGYSNIAGRDENDLITRTENSEATQEANPNTSEESTDAKPLSGIKWNLLKGINRVLKSSGSHRKNLPQTTVLQPSISTNMEKSGQGNALSGFPAPERDQSTSSTREGGSCKSCRQDSLRCNCEPQARVPCNKTDPENVTSSPPTLEGPSGKSQGEGIEPSILPAQESIPLSRPTQEVDSCNYPGGSRDQKKMSRQETVDTTYSLSLAPSKAVAHDSSVACSGAVSAAALDLKKSNACYSEELTTTLVKDAVTSLIVESKSVIDTKEQDRPQRSVETSGDSRMLQRVDHGECDSGIVRDTTPKIVSNDTEIVKENGDVNQKRLSRDRVDPSLSNATVVSMPTEATANGQTLGCDERPSQVAMDVSEDGGSLLNFIMSLNREENTKGSETARETISKGVAACSAVGAKYASAVLPMRVPPNAAFPRSSGEEQGSYLDVPKARKSIVPLFSHNMILVPVSTYSQSSRLIVPGMKVKFSRKTSPELSLMSRDPEAGSKHNSAKESLGSSALGSRLLKFRPGTGSNVRPSVKDACPSAHQEEDDTAGLQPLLDFTKHLRHEPTVVTKASADDDKDTRATSAVKIDERRNSGETEGDKGLSEEKKTSKKCSEVTDAVTSQSVAHQMEDSENDTLGQEMDTVDCCKNQNATAARERDHSSRRCYKRRGKKGACSHGISGVPGVIVVSDEEEVAKQSSSVSSHRKVGMRVRSLDSKNAKAKNPSDTLNSSSGLQSSDNFACTPETDCSSDKSTNHKAQAPSSSPYDGVACDVAHVSSEKLIALVKEKVVESVVRSFSRMSQGPSDEASDFLKGLVANMVGGIVEGAVEGVVKGVRESEECLQGAVGHIDRVRKATSTLILAVMEGLLKGTLECSSGNCSNKVGNLNPSIERSTKGLSTSTGEAKHTKRKSRDEDSSSQSPEVAGRGGIGGIVDAVDIASLAHPQVLANNQSEEFPSSVAATRSTPDLISAESDANNDVISDISALPSRAPSDGVADARINNKINDTVGLANEKGSCTVIKHSQDMPSNVIDTPKVQGLLPGNEDGDAGSVKIFLDTGSSEINATFLTSQSLEKQIDGFKGDINEKDPIFDGIAGDATHCQSLSLAKSNGQGNPEGKEPLCIDVPKTVPSVAHDGMDRSNIVLENVGRVDIRSRSEEGSYFEEKEDSNPQVKWTLRKTKKKETDIFQFRDLKSAVVSSMVTEASHSLTRESTSHDSGSEDPAIASSSDSVNSSNDADYIPSGSASSVSSSYGSHSSAPQTPESGDNSSRTSETSASGARTSGALTSIASSSGALTMSSHGIENGIASSHPSKEGFCLVRGSSWASQQWPKRNQEKVEHERESQVEKGKVDIDPDPLVLVPLSLLPQADRDILATLQKGNQGNKQNLTSLFQDVQELVSNAAENMRTNLPKFPAAIRSAENQCNTAAEFQPPAETKTRFEAPAESKAPKSSFSPESQEETLDDVNTRNHDESKRQRLVEIDQRKVQTNLKRLSSRLLSLTDLGVKKTRSDEGSFLRQNCCPASDGYGKSADDNNLKAVKSIQDNPRLTAGIQIATTAVTEKSPGKGIRSQSTESKHPMQKGMELLRKKLQPLSKSLQSPASSSSIPVLSGKANIMGKRQSSEDTKTSQTRFLSCVDVNSSFYKKEVLPQMRLLSIEAHDFISCGCQHRREFNKALRKKLHGQPANSSLRRSTTMSEVRGQRQGPSNATSSRSTAKLPSSRPYNVFATSLSQTKGSLKGDDRTVDATYDIDAASARCYCSRSRLLNNRCDFCLNAKTSCSQASGLIRVAPGIDAKFELTVVWRKCLYKCIDATPLCICDGDEKHSSGMVIIGSHSHFMMALDHSRGSLLWCKKLPNRIESSPILSKDGRWVVVGCYDGRLYVLDRSTGEEYWSFQTGDTIKCSPTVHNQTGIVYIGSHDGYTYALNIYKKMMLWSHFGDGGSCFASPSISQDGHRVLVATLQGRIFSLCTESGSVQWSYRCSSPIFSSPLTVADGTVVGSVEGKVVKLDHTGVRRWTLVVGGSVFSSPVFVPKSHFNTQGTKVALRVSCVDDSVETLNGDDISQTEGAHNEMADGYLAFGCHDNHIYLVDIKGTLVWKRQVDAPVYASPCLVHVKSEREAIPRPYLICASTKGSLYVFELHTGDTKAILHLGGEIFSSPVCFANRIFIGSRNDHMHCLQLTVKDGP